MQFRTYSSRQTNSRSIRRPLSFESLQEPEFLRLRTEITPHLVHLDDVDRLRDRVERCRSTYWQTKRSMDWPVVPSNLPTARKDSSCPHSVTVSCFVDSGIGMFGRHINWKPNFGTTSAACPVCGQISPPARCHSTGTTVIHPNQPFLVE